MAVFNSSLTPFRPNSGHGDLVFNPSDASSGIAVPPFKQEQVWPKATHGFHWPGPRDAFVLCGHGLVSTWIQTTPDSYGWHQLAPGSLPPAHSLHVSRCGHLQLDDASWKQRWKQLVFTGIFTEHSAREARKALTLRARGLKRTAKL